MGYLLVQGGDEFHDACREMDSAFLDAVGAETVAILPAASESVPAAQAAAAHARSYYRSLGVSTVIVADGDSRTAATTLGQANAVVLPGGSPGLLLDRLVEEQGLLADALRAVLLAGGGISGASAGAMVLAAATWLPDRDRVVPGLGLLPSSQPLLVLPHADGTPTRWLGIAEAAQTVAPGLHCLALAEHSGRLYGAGQERDFGTTFIWE